MEQGGKDGEALKEVVDAQKKKISTLKKAFLQKQEDAKKLQQTQKEQELRIFLLEKSIEEHVQYTQKERQRRLEHEVVEKTDEISHLQSLLKGLASATAEQQMKKLLEEYSALKIAYTRLEESTRVTRQELHHSKKRESEQTADSEETTQQLRTDLAELTKKLEALQTDNLMTRKTNVQLSDKNSKLEEESEQLRKQLRELRSELELKDFTLKGK